MDSPKNYEPVKYKETQDISILFGDNVAQVDHESLVTMMALQHKVHEGRVFGVGYRNPTAGTVGWDVYVNPPSTGTLHVFAIVQSDGDCYYEAGWVSSVSPGSTTLTPANYNYESTQYRVLSCGWRNYRIIRKYYSYGLIGFRTEKGHCNRDQGL